LVFQRAIGLLEEEKEEEGKMAGGIVPMEGRNPEKRTKDRV
jgi:hypothetical protein